MLLALMAVALAAPTYELTDNTLSVSGAEVAVVRAAEPGTPQPDMITPTAFWDESVGIAVAGESMAWILAPGVYAVTAFAPASADGRREEVAWEVEVASPRPLTRAERIRVALFGLLEAVTAWQALAPTDAEIFAAVRAGPLAHPTKAGAVTP